MSNDRVEFIDQKKEDKELHKIDIKKLISGRLFGGDFLQQNFRFILFMAFLAALYITNRYQAEKLLRRSVKLQDELKELRAESISTASELMYHSRQTQVKLLVDERGLGLKEAVEPPKKIKMH